MYKITDKSLVPNKEHDSRDPQVALATTRAPGLHRKDSVNLSGALGDTTTDTVTRSALLKGYAAITSRTAIVACKVARQQSGVSQTYTSALESFTTLPLQQLYHL